MGAVCPLSRKARPPVAWRRCDCGGAEHVYVVAVLLQELLVVGYVRFLALRHALSGGLLELVAVRLVVLAQYLALVGFHLLVVNLLQHLGQHVLVERYVEVGVLYAGAARKYSA